MASYIVYLLDGNTIQGKTIKASTAKGYLQAVNVFCSANSQAMAVNLKLPTSKAVRLLAEQVKFKQLPDQRLPFTPPMTYAIVVKATENESHLGFTCSAANWLCVGHLTAQRLQEFADRKDEVMIYISRQMETRSCVLTCGITWCSLISIMGMYMANRSKKEPM